MFQDNRCLILWVDKTSTHIAEAWPPATNLYRDRSLIAITRLMAPSVYFGDVTVILDWKGRTRITQKQENPQYLSGLPTAM